MLRLGLKDDAGVCVNGKCVLDGLKAWKLVPDASNWIPVSLRAGRNIVLVKLSHADAHPWCHCQFHDHPLQQALFRLELGAWSEAADAFAEADRPAPLEAWRYTRWLRVLLAAGRR